MSAAPSLVSRHNDRLFPVMLEETLYNQWLKIKEATGLETDSQIAHLLLEGYTRSRKQQPAECHHCNSPLVCAHCQTLHLPPTITLHNDSHSDRTSVLITKGQDSQVTSDGVEVSRGIRCVNSVFQTKSEQSTDNPEGVDVECTNADQDSKNHYNDGGDCQGETSVISYSSGSHLHENINRVVSVKVQPSESDAITVRPCGCQRCRDSCERGNIQSEQFSPVVERRHVAVECKNCDQSSLTGLRMQIRAGELAEGVLPPCEKCKQGSHLPDSLLAQKFHGHGANLFLICQLCGERFVSESLLAEHMIKHQDDGSYAHQSRGVSESSVQICTNRRELQSPLVVTGLSQQTTCQICHKVFKFKSSLKVHMKSHLKEKVICSRCKLPFKTERYLKAHLNDCSQSCRCTVCGTNFSTGKLLQVHLLQHSCKKSYPCRYCEQVFHTKSTLDAHVAAKHQKSKDACFRCDHCDCGFKFKKQLARHTKTHQEEKPYVCGECGAKFKKSAYLQRHQTVHEDGRNAVCHICGKCCLGLKYLANHMKTCHNDKLQTEKPYKCTDCTASFALLSLLTVHRAVHGRHSDFMCHHCGRAFKTQHTLTVHMRKHTGEKPFQCSHCQEKFIDKRGVKRHELQHKPSSELCHVCGSSFPTKALLAMHLERHSGERPFQCKLCGKGYKTFSDLSKHMKYHSDDKPFQCSQCPYAFHTKAMLRNHQRKHTGETPFKCQQCSASFRYLSSLAAHRKRHSGNKPFVCDVCGATFFQSYNLRLHYRKHSGEKPYQCSQCPESFAWHSGLKCHMKKHQPESVT